MASITTLLATDSLASSRIVLNDNFAALNDELSDIAGLLDTSAQTLTLTGSISGGSLALANVLTANSASINAAVPFTAEAEVILEEGFRHSIVNPAAQMPTTYTATTYVLDGTQLSNVTVSAGNSGQEVTFIAEGADVSVNMNTSDIAGATNITILQNGTLTLRYVGSFWYIISDVNCNISF